jgi:hypothetical protein
MGGSEGSLRNLRSGATRAPQLRIAKLIDDWIDGLSSRPAPVLDYEPNSGHPAIERAELLGISAGALAKMLGEDVEIVESALSGLPIPKDLDAKLADWMNQAILPDGNGGFQIL